MTDDKPEQPEDTGLVIRSVRTETYTYHDLLTSCSLCWDEFKNLVAINRGHICSKCAAKVIEKTAPNP